MPGLVSTLLNQAYSMPGRLVHTFLQVTEHVWQPMHLSRFSTMLICALTFMPVSSPTSASLKSISPPLRGGGPGREGFLSCSRRPCPDSAPRRFAHEFSYRFSMSLDGTDQLVGDRGIQPVDLYHLAHHHELVAVG